MIEWEKIRSLAKGAKIDIADLLYSDMGSGVYKLSENQYVIAKADAEWDLKSLELVSVYWAVSEQGFRRAYFNDLDNDDNVTGIPPVSLLPEKSAVTYDAIRGALITDADSGFLEHASYRVMSDGAFVYKTLDSKNMGYLFRSSKASGLEQPFCVIVKKF